MNDVKLLVEGERRAQLHQLVDDLCDDKREQYVEGLGPAAPLPDVLDLVQGVLLGALGRVFADEKAAAVAAVPAFEQLIGTLVEARDEHRATHPQHE